MPLTEGDKGPLLLDGTIQDLIATVTGLKYYSGHVFLDNLVSGDSIEFVIYIYDPVSATQKIYDKFTVSGLQTTPTTFIPNLPTEQFRVTAQQTASGVGGYKTINFVRYDS